MKKEKIIRLIIFSSNALLFFSFGFSLITKFSFIKIYFFPALVIGVIDSIYLAYIILSWLHDLSNYVKYLDDTFTGIFKGIIGVLEKHNDIFTNLPNKDEFTKSENNKGSFYKDNNGGTPLSYQNLLMRDKERDLIIQNIQQQYSFIKWVIPFGITIIAIIVGFIGIIVTIALVKK